MPWWATDRCSPGNKTFYIQKKERDRLKFCFETVSFFILGFKFSRISCYKEEVKLSLENFILPDYFYELWIIKKPIQRLLLQDHVPWTVIRTHYQFSSIHEDSISWSVCCPWGFPIQSPHPVVADSGTQDLTERGVSRNPSPWFSLTGDWPIQFFPTCSCGTGILTNSHSPDERVTVCVSLNLCPVVTGNFKTCKAFYNEKLHDGGEDFWS